MHIYIIQLCVCVCVCVYTSITVWFSSATKSDLRRLRRVVRTAERIIGTTLPTLQELYLSRVSKRAGKITLDPSHPVHSLFELLPLQSSEHQNDQTQEQFLPSGNPSHEHLTIIMVHTHSYTLIYLTHLVYISIAHNIPVHTKTVYCYMPVHTLSICILLLRIYFVLFILFIICVFCSVTVILLRCGNVYIYIYIYI